jgi:hypothetical protein
MWILINKCCVRWSVTGVYLEKIVTVFFLLLGFILSVVYFLFLYLFLLFPCFVSSSVPFSIMITFCSFRSSFRSSSGPACYQSSSATTQHSGCHSLALSRIHFTPRFLAHISFHQPRSPGPLVVTADKMSNVVAHRHRGYTCLSL